MRIGLWEARGRWLYATQSYHHVFSLYCVCEWFAFFDLLLPVVCMRS
jgi:hypothetical protein